MRGNGWGQKESRKKKFPAGEREREREGGKEGCKAEGEAPRDGRSGGGRCSVSVSSVRDARREKKKRDETPRARARQRKGGS